MNYEYDLAISFAGEERGLAEHVGASPRPGGILSSAYLEKPWTKHERRSAIEEFIERRSDFILCLKAASLPLPLVSTP